MNESLTRTNSDISWAQTIGWVSSIFAVVFASITGLFLWLAIQDGGRAWQPSALALINAGVTASAVRSSVQSRRNNIDSALVGLLLAIIISQPFISAIAEDQGNFRSLFQLVVLSFIIWNFVSNNRRSTFLILNVISAGLTLFLELTGIDFRYTPAFAQPYPIAIFSLGMIFVFVIVLISRQRLNMPAKITLASLLTGGITLGVMYAITSSRTTAIADYLSQRLETQVVLLTEEQLINVLTTETAETNRLFEELAHYAEDIATQKSNFDSQRSVFSQNNYWDARFRLDQRSSGQYGNVSTEPSSVFVPSYVELTDSVVADLNTTAFFDFSVPHILKENQIILAIYFVDTQGVTRYYPNIGLADDEELPADFNATEAPFFEVATPLLNPEKHTRWSTPYIDPAGGGLVVTAAHPIYSGNAFKGIVGVDVQLSAIAEAISQVKVGQTGFGFMIDEAGRIIYMPDQGYSTLGLDKERLTEGEFSELSILTQGQDELDSLTARMAAGDSGLGRLTIRGTDLYLAYKAVPSTGYSLGIVVPVAEMQSALAIVTNETEQQVAEARSADLFALLLLLAGAVIVSFVSGQLLTAPIKNLTATTNKIAKGDLDAEAPVLSNDEIGTLAISFNTMTERLRETLLTLEKNVDERTLQLNQATQQIEQRAKQFETIAAVSRTISSTQKLDELLPEIVNAISERFGFYHVGIFLLDAQREYAILSAANSEGGQAMLTEGHQLKVGQVGIVGYVTGTGMPRVALDTGEDAVFFNNPHLPNTRSEIALPLHAGTQLIGALDVQSEKPNAFGTEDIAILGALAEQVSIALQNARQYEETQKALSEAQALSRQFSRTGWDDFTKSRKLIGVKHSGARAMLMYENDEDTNSRSSKADQALGKSRGVSLRLPLKVRDEQIGVLEVRTPGNRQWNQDEVEIVSAILDRAALTMENARFLDDSQRRAAKERVIGEIASKISAQNRIEELIKTAALELGRTLPGTEIAIQFSHEEK